MARFERLEVYQTILAGGLVPLFYHGDTDIALQAVEACRAGGSRVLEFTNRGDQALPVFATLAQKLAETKSNLILGVGSVIDAPTAALFIAYGANFVVGPSLNPEIARLCNRRKIAYIPGCASVSEISQAEELGAEIIKVFPGDSVGGPDFIKALLGPCPWSKIMPTGGVEANPDSLRAWIKAGAACLGMGSNLVSKDLVSGKRWQELADRVSQVLEWIRQARA